MDFNFKTILVIGYNPALKIKLYSADTKVEPYVKFKYSERENLYKTHLAFAEELAKSDSVDDNRKKHWQEVCEALDEMTPEEFFEFHTRGLKIDEKTGDAISESNPVNYYMYEKCYDEDLKERGVEAPFSNPFKLKDGTKAYSARVNEIDWEKMHMANTEPYKRAWELVVEDDSPKTEMDETIKRNMNGKKGYFLNFKDKDEYIKYSCSFWCYGVIDEDNQYDELGLTGGDEREWIFSFYDRFIAPLRGDELLTIYEAKNDVPSNK